MIPENEKIEAAKFVLENKAQGKTGKEIRLLLLKAGYDELEIKDILFQSEVILAELEGREAPSRHEFFSEEEKQIMEFRKAKRKQPPAEKPKPVIQKIEVGPIEPIKRKPELEEKFSEKPEFIETFEEIPPMKLEEQKERKQRAMEKVRERFEEKIELSKSFAKTGESERGIASPHVSVPVRKEKFELKKEIPEAKEEFTFKRPEITVQKPKAVSPREEEKPFKFSLKGITGVWAQQIEAERRKEAAEGLEERLQKEREAKKEMSSAVMSKLSELKPHKYEFKEVESLKEEPERKSLMKGLLSKVVKIEEVPEDEMEINEIPKKKELIPLKPLMKEPEKKEEKSSFSLSKIFGKKPEEIKNMEPKNISSEESIEKLKATKEKFKALEKKLEKEE